MAMERRQAEAPLLDLLKEAAEDGFINSSQITKGFSRLIDTVDDLSLDIPNAREILQQLISKAASEGWLCVSSLKSLSVEPERNSITDSDAARSFKIKSQSIIQEYFLSGDILEVNSCIEQENKSNSAELNAIFVKKLITLAMDRKNREKEMASVLLSSLCFPADDVVSGFVMLIESADDTALDNPVVVEDLAMFLARAVVDEVLAPQNLEEIGSQCLSPDSIGSKVLRMAKSSLKATLSGERILRCWGGGGSSRTSWAVEDVKDKIGKLLEEYESGGDIREACRCIKELGMPFFHHEVVKKSLVTIMEKKNERLWGLLRECFESGLITFNQMMKGFGRVAESLEDLALDVPDARTQFAKYVERAKNKGWLDNSFCFGKQEHENGTC
ncbi:MA3 DOMAIN-CONTAINING TRANSLATION REGULATORY FACTOR 2 [Stylosanthes scabra]|uniref:MA3 DOMAIN-CONTAINING TRANSLATION REGULATORY FACTOR 2 n=1 Tax=Stylosanthes scabra TaxID=79078 RepID=A0ABU6S0B9_9FABA|nr:MA3 DOMAIN-CONTAINING TRANSLATION REGULATORY FACTOR 2 [Stylosanthes scabra]